MIGIYKITNLLNGKAYVGQSIHIERRWQEHCQPSADSTIGKAIQEYGKDNFKFEILESFEIEDSNQLAEREDYYIDFYDTIVPNGYNVLQHSATNGTTTFVTINQKEYYEIVDAIQNTSRTFEDIAAQYGLNRRTINRINHGYTHRMPELTYPLRDTKTANMKQHKYCIDCGIEINLKATRCVTCAAKKTRVCERPSREELKQLIRTTPFTKIGEKYGVRDNSIRKWCDAYNLPRKATEIKKISDEDWALL